MKTVLGYLAGAAIGIVLFQLARVLFLGGSLPFLPFQPESATPASVERTLMATPASVYLTVLRDRSPQEYDVLLDGLAETVRTGGSESEVMTASAEHSAAIRRDNAVHLWRAPQASVARLVGAQRDILAALADDPPACALVVMDGPLALGPDGIEQVADVVAEAAAAVFEALYDGRDAAGPGIAPPADADFASTIDQWRAAGATPAEVDLVLTPDVGDPGLCAAFIALLGFLAGSSDPAVQRVRTEIMFQSLSI
jgi:hypothetical protein